MTSIAAGGLAAGLALLALTVDETDEAFANVYSTAVSLQNALPRVPQRLLIGVAAAGATVGALADHVGRVRDVPVPARLVLRAAVRRAAGGLAAGGRPLHARRRLRGAAVPAADDRRVAGRLLPLPVAPSHRAERAGPTSWRTRSRQASAPRCRASPSRSCSRRSSRSGTGADDRARRHRRRRVRGRSRDRGHRAGAGAVEPQHVETGLPRVVCAGRSGLDRRRRRRRAPAARRVARRRPDVAGVGTRVAARLRGGRARGRSRRRPLRRTQPALPLAGRRPLLGAALRRAARHRGGRARELQDGPKRSSSVRASALSRRHEPARPAREPSSAASRTPPSSAHRRRP